MQPKSPPGVHVVAVLVATTAMLIARAITADVLVDRGFPSLVASDLAFLASLPVLLLLAFPVLRKDRSFIRDQFRPTDISVRLILAAIVIGLLFRIAWWGQLMARISFGLVAVGKPDAVEGTFFKYACPDLSVIALGALVAAVLTPVIEEITHRGYVQSYFAPRGAFLAVSLSAVTFMVFHRYSSWGFALAGGALLGVMYLHSRSLWAPVIAHAVINLEPQLTWRCMSVYWNPPAQSLPLWMPGLAGSAAFMAATLLIVVLVCRCVRRRDRQPRRLPASQCVRNAFDDVRRGSD